MEKTSRQRLCVVCGTEFILRANGARNIVCSEKCAGVRTHGVARIARPSCSRCLKPVSAINENGVCCKCQASMDRGSGVVVECRDCGVKVRAKSSRTKWCSECREKNELALRQMRSHRKSMRGRGEISGVSNRVGMAGEMLFDAVMALHGIASARSTVDNQAVWDRVISIDGQLRTVQIKTASEYRNGTRVQISNAHKVSNAVMIAAVVLEDASVHLIESGALDGSIGRSVIDTLELSMCSLWISGERTGAAYGDANQMEATGQQSQATQQDKEGVWQRLAAGEAVGYGTGQMALSGLY